MRRAALSMATLLLAVVALSPAALADPKTEPLWLDCVGAPSGTVTVNGNGHWTPGLASDSTGVYVPYAFEFAFYFTPDGGVEELVESDTVAKKAPNNSKKRPHGVCTFGETFPVDDPELGTGTGRFTGTVWVFYTG